MIVRTTVSLFAALLLLIVSVVGDPAAQEATPSTPILSDLEDIEQFRDLFNDQAGKPRLILLIAPT